MEKSFARELVHSSIKLEMSCTIDTHCRLIGDNHAQHAFAVYTLHYKAGALASLLIVHSNYIRIYTTIIYAISTHCPNNHIIVIGNLNTW